MITVTQILGTASSPSIAPQLHELQHQGRVEYLVVDRAGMLRRRFRGTTDKGTDVAIALADSRLGNGSVLLLERDRAIVLRMREEQWLKIVPRDLDAALEVGYFAGNMHWRVRFDKGGFWIALDAPIEDFTSKLAAFISSKRIEITHDA